MSAKITVKNDATKRLRKLLRVARNLAPAMRQIERRVLMVPIAGAWQRSGLRARSHELRKAVQAWSGRRSAGLSLRSKRGRDLVLPKAYTHTFGAHKQQWHGKGAFKSEYPVFRKSGRAFMRKNPGSPWGAIPARPFFPDTGRFTAQRDRMGEIITKFILEQAGK